MVVHLFRLRPKMLTIVHHTIGPKITIEFRSEHSLSKNEFQLPLVEVHVVLINYLALHQLLWPCFHRESILNIAVRFLVLLHKHDRTEPDEL